MTENATGTTSAAPGQPGEGPGAPPPPPGWNTDNLKDYRRLRRDRVDRKVAGVAGGLGRHLNVDPMILRVLFVVLAFFGGAGIVLYGALWLFVPEEGSESVVISTSESSRNGLLIAAAVVAGALALGDTWSGFWFPWPVAIVGLVVAAVLLSRDNRGTISPPGPPPAAPAAGAPWYPPTPPPYVPPRPRRQGPLLFGITLALIALALGVLGLYDASATSVPDTAYPALALGVTGLMLVVGAFWGRPGGLVALGLVAALVMAAFSIGNPTFDGDRDVRIEPRLASDVEDSYDVPAGRIVLDLSQVSDPEELDGRRIELSANAGEITVILPDDVAADFGANVSYGGAIETPVGSRDGWNTDLHGHLGDKDAVAVINLELDLQFGRIAVNQR
jgi:phage shock protein PspC (stress-responsive transcriptional regulator)